jgi:rubrerythrin
MTEPLTRGRTRREAMAGAGGFLAGTTVVGALRPRLASAREPADAGILASLLDLERAAVAAYSAALSSGLLRRDLAATLGHFLDQERQHVAALSRALGGLGGRPRDAAPTEVTPVDPPGSQAGLLRVAVDLEAAAIAGYVDAMAGLQGPELLALVTRIAASEGQHLVVLRQALGASPAESVPSAFEAGTDQG